MSTVTITTSNFHTANCHCDVAITGDFNLTLQAVDVAQLLTVPDQNAILGFLNCIAWMAQNGRTLAQTKTLTNAGVAITV